MFELLGVSPANLIVAVVAALVLLGACVTFVYLGARAFLGDDAGAVIQSMLVGAFGAVSAIWDNAKQTQNADAAQEASPNRLTELITAKARAVVGKLCQTKDDSLGKVLRALGSATDAISGAVDAVDSTAASLTGTGSGNSTSTAQPASVPPGSNKFAR